MKPDTPDDSTSSIPSYVNDSTPETTVRAVVLGTVLGVVLGAANVYLGLYAGITVSASIPAAVISMAILRGLLRTGTILENNIVQTIASSGESMAAGVIFTVPALVLVGAWTKFEYWPTTLITMLGGLLGIIFMVPLRRTFIVERRDLPFPEGVACAEVLKAGQAGGAGVLKIGAGLLVGATLKFLIDAVGLVKAQLQGAFTAGRSVFYGGTDISAALVAVGYIVNINVAAQIFLGGGIIWFVALPLAGGYDGGDAIASVTATWKESVRYIGVGAMLVGGVSSLWQVRTGLMGAFRVLRNFRAAGSSANTPRTDRDLPMSVLLAVLTFCFFGILGLYYYLIGSFFIALVSAVVMIVASFIFVAVATYIVGLVGSSNSPVSGMTICALLLTAGVLYVLGVRGDVAKLAVLGVAGVVCCAASTAGDIAQDLKTGQLIGATPARQQWMEFVGAIVPSFFFAPILQLLHQHYGIGDKLRAPQAALFASLTEGFFGEGKLPLNMVYIGIGIGIAVLFINAGLARTKNPLRLYLMPIAVGMYLPLSAVTPIFIGGLLRARFARRKTDDANDAGVLFGSGLVAGEALMGIGLAGVVGFGWFPLLKTPSSFASVLAWALLIAIYASFARRSTKTN